MYTLPLLCKARLDCNGNPTLMTPPSKRTDRADRCRRSAKQQRQGGEQEKKVTQLLKIHPALIWSKAPTQTCHQSALRRKERNEFGAFSVRVTEGGVSSKSDFPSFVYAIVLRVFLALMRRLLIRILLNRMALVAVKTGVLRDSLLCEAARALAGRRGGPTCSLTLPFPCIYSVLQAYPAVLYHFLLKLA